MMKRILVPLDGSPLAERALAVAARLARSVDGTLILVQALTLPVEYGSPFMPQVVPLSVPERDSQAQAYLTRQAGLPKLSGLPVETAVRSEAPAMAVLNAATDYRADMIVMTSHGRTGMSHWIFGSVAGHVAREAEVPVLVLREHRPPFWTAGAEMGEGPKTAGPVDTFPQLRVLVPLDGSPLAETVLEPAACCAVSLVRGVEQATGIPKGAIGCLMHFVLILQPLDVMLEHMPGALVLTGAETYLKRVANRLAGAHPGLAASWEVVEGTDVADTLVRIVEAKEPAEGQKVLLASREAGTTPSRGDSGEYDLLAMATHGRTGITRWVWGSITERVVQKTQLPLLLVRPRASVW
jgi:nucleotide-binding universal stress UspA family protein